MHEKTVLDNGLRILSQTMPHIQSLSIVFFIGVGSRYETDVEAGISHFVEHLCFKGTEKRLTAAEISETIEGVGGIFNGGTDKEVTTYWCKVARPHFELALDVLVDILLHSRFDSEDIEKERRIIIDEINMCKDSPSNRVQMLIDELLWTGHPLGRDIAGSPESIQAITRRHLLDYRERHYPPDNMVISVAGDIPHHELVSAIDRALDSRGKRQSHREYTAYHHRPGPRQKVETRETEQAHFCLALPGLSLFHPQRFTLDLLNIILGEGMSSRLFTEIRDRLGLVYNISSYVEHFLDTGSLIVYAGVEPDNLKIALAAILEQLDRLKQPVPARELLKAKEMTKGRLLLRMEDSRSVAGSIGGQEILTGRVYSVDQIVALIDAISADEVSRLAGELLTGDRLRLAVVGPIAADEPLEELLKL